MASTYAVVVVLLTLPALYTAFPAEAAKGGAVPWRIFKEPVYLGFVAAVAISQFVLIQVPIRLQFRRPVTRRGLMLPILASGFWMGLLVMGAIWSLLEWRKVEPIESRAVWWIGLPVLTWGVWALVFWRMSASRAPTQVLRRQTSAMLSGSILELLIAVPTHIVARQRPDCCAGFFTFFGITMGLSVMFLAFGPAVFVLYLDRWRRLRG